MSECSILFATFVLIWSLWSAAKIFEFKMKSKNTYNAPIKKKVEPNQSQFPEDDDIPPFGEAGCSMGDYGE